MDQATTSTMEKKTVPRQAQQSSKLHVQDHKDVSSKKTNGNRRRQKEWERDGGASGNGGGGHAKASNGGAGAMAGRVGCGRSAVKAARNREKKGGQIGYGSEWSHDDVDSEFFDDNVLGSSGGSARHPCNITQSFQSWWGREGGQRGPNSRGGAGVRQTNSGGGNKRQYHNSRGSAMNKITNSKARFLQARCQFVMNPLKEAQHLASTRVPVGFSLAAPVKTSYPVGAPLLADPKSVAQQPLAEKSASCKQGDDDPDALVPWVAVEEVMIHMTQPTHCPVCLYPPVAPQVTRCGHIYCYPCILHYLALSDKKWRACPICYEMVVRDDLKSAVCIVHPDYSVGNSISMVLMRRDRHSMQPSAVLPPHDYSPHSLARKIPATRAMVLSISEREQSALEVQLAAESTEPEACFIEEALTFVKERKQALLEEYFEQHEPSVHDITVPGQNMDGSNAELTDSGEGSTNDSGEASTHENDGCCDDVTNENFDRRNSFATTSSPVTMTEMFASTPIEECTLLNSDSLYGLSESSSTLTGLDEVLSVGEENVPLLGCMKTLELLEVVEENDAGSNRDQPRESECLNFDLEGETCDLKETLKSTVSEHAVRSSHVVASPKTTYNAPKSTYYFYQASDGSHVYLHSINMAMLRNHYGSEENCPPTINATIVEKDYFLMDEDLRNRFKALRHLPLCCAFETVELILQSPVVSQETISIFRKRLSDRQHQRDSRAKEESLIERRNLEQQEKEFSSSLFTRVYSATSSMACNSAAGNRPRSSASVSSDGGGSGITDFPDMAPGHSGRIASVDGYSSPELATSPPARTPQQQQLSFAKMLRVQATTASSSAGGGTAAVAWPSLGRNSTAGARTVAAGTGAWGSSSPRPSTVPGKTVRPSSTTGSAVRPDTTSDDDELFNVPDYSQTFSRALDLSLQAAEAAAAARQAGSEGKKSKKGKKKQKQVLIFSSGL